MAKKNQRALSPFLGWPAFIARQPGDLRKVVDGLVDSQWWSADQIDSGWQFQLKLLAGWAVNNVPYYKRSSEWRKGLERLQRARYDFWDIWREMPLLAKPTLRSQGDHIRIEQVPAHHTPLSPVTTSGSTGVPVQVTGTPVTGRNWAALTIRDHLAWQRDFSRSMGAIRWLPEASQGATGVRSRDWGRPVNELFDSAPGGAIHVAHAPSTHAAWLQRLNPTYLLTYPSIAEAVLEEMGDAGRPSGLREIRFMSEPLDDSLKQRLNETWDIECADMYSANEVGHIAQTCPEHGRLHVQAESVYVEIIDDHGKPSAPGETGRLVVTALHNLASPLLRYEIGDYAVVGEPCACGRAAPVIDKVMGRVRNYAISPSGERFWPGSLGRLRHLDAIQQFQYVQTAQDSIEARVVVSRPLSTQERDQAVEYVRGALGHPYQVEILPVERIERGPSGKYEEFMSLINEP